jgi:hypothetical protein
VLSHASFNPGSDFGKPRSRNCGFLSALHTKPSMLYPSHCIIIDRHIYAQHTTFQCSTQYSDSSTLKHMCLHSTPTDQPQEHALASPRRSRRGHQPQTSWAIACPEQLPMPFLHALVEALLPYSWIPYDSSIIIRQSGLTLRQYCITIGSVITFVSALCALRRLSYFLGPDLSSCSLG